MWKHTRIVAHRGGAGLWPENSMAAIRGAIELGVDAIEVDVHPCAEGVPIVVHDPMWDRTTTGSGLVVDTPLLSIQGIERPILAGGEVVPTLRDVLDVVAPTPVGMSVELKTDIVDGAYPGLVDKVVADLDAHGLLKPLAVGGAFVHAFHWKYLEEMRARSPDVDLGCNVKRDWLERFGSWRGVLDAVEHLGMRHINADHRLIDDEAQRLIKSRGFELTLWTVNDDAEIYRFLEPRRAATLGPVDHLCTDRPDAALAARSSFETAAA